MISSPRSSRSQSSWMTAAMSRSTPRVRWNFSSVDQSSKSWSKSSGWIGYADSIRCAIRRLLAPRAGTRRVLLVEVAEGVDDRVALARELGRHLLEEPPPHDLEALLGRGRLPRRLLPEDHVREPLERLLARLAADLDVRRRDRDDEHRVLARSSPRRRAPARRSSACRTSRRRGRRARTAAARRRPTRRSGSGTASCARAAG